MKTLFVGPTLCGIASPGDRLAGSDVLCRPPAQQGDIARAVLDGASVIGLVDGRYDDVAAPWHKEILFALSRGVVVYGAASMGALRAAECAAFGMVPVGGIAARYLSGDLTDDAAVAQLHAPADLGCTPITEALVNVHATIDDACASGATSRHEAEMLSRAAERTFFKDRTYPAIVRAAGFTGDHAAVLLDRLMDCSRDIKREDALELVGLLAAPPPGPGARSWTFNETASWRRLIANLQQRRAPDE